MKHINSLGILRGGDNLKVSFKEKSALLIWMLGFVIVVSYLVYFAFAKPKAAGMLTSGVQIVKADNVQQIETYKKYNSAYALKIQEDNKFYLKYYYYENNKPIESKLEVTSEQFNKLNADNKYWFMVKFAKIDDYRSGTIKEIFKEDPTQK
jgi:hypothetical protein